MPEMASTSVIIDDNDIMPLEPNLTKIKYLKRNPVASIDARVGRLAEGVTIDIPPQYDHYGYEIRRYMKNVGNIKIFDDDKFIEEQIINIKKASVIAQYWKKSLEKEIREIELLLASDGSVSLSTRTEFNQNRTKVKKLMLVIQGWLNANEKLLMHIFNTPDQYKVYYPEIIIFAAQERLDFHNLTTIRQAKLQDIKQYIPFVMMVY